MFFSIRRAHNFNSGLNHFTLIFVPFLATLSNKTSSLSFTGPLRLAKIRSLHFYCSFVILVTLAGILKTEYFAEFSGSCQLGVVIVGSCELLLEGSLLAEISVFSVTCTATHSNA